MLRYRTSIGPSNLNLVGKDSRSPLQQLLDTYEKSLEKLETPERTRDIQKELEEMELPYRVDEAGKPESADDRARALRFILDNPEQAAWNHRIIEEAADKYEIDIQSYLEG